MKEPLRQRKKNQTRRAIVETAANLFRKKGFDATTLEEIADAADVHKQTVLRYFKSKEEIAFARRNKVFEHFAETLHNRTGTVLQHWRDYIQESSRATMQSGELKDWFEFIDSDTRLFAYQLRVNERYQQELIRALSEEAGTDPERDIFPRVLAALLVSGNSNVARMTIATGQPHNLERNALAVVDLGVKLQREAAQAPPKRTASASEG